MALLVSSQLLWLTTIFDCPRSIAGRSSSCGHPAAGRGGAGAIASSPAHAIIDPWRKVTPGGILRNGTKRAEFLCRLILR